VGRVQCLRRGLVGWCGAHGAAPLHWRKSTEEGDYASPAGVIIMVGADRSEDHG
jgi:hypothetical protein